VSEQRESASLTPTSALKEGGISLESCDDAGLQVVYLFMFQSNNPQYDAKKQDPRDRLIPTL